MSFAGTGSVLAKNCIEYPMHFVLNAPVLMPQVEQDRWGSLVGLQACDSIVEGACDFARAQVDGAAFNLEDLSDAGSMKLLLHIVIQRFCGAQGVLDQTPMPFGGR